MAPLSTSDIIQKHPIGRGLDAFRDTFSSACAELDCRDLSDAVRQFSHEGKMLQPAAMPFITRIDLRNLVLDLFLTLQNLSAARYLASPTGLEVVLRDLSRFVSLVVSDKFDVTSIVPLLEEVIKCAADEDIWSAVSALVAARATPPTVFNVAALDTPLKSTTSSQQGSEQTHDEIDPRILQEINGCVYQNTRGFYEKYFERRSWSTTVEKIVRDVSPRIADGHWTKYPDPPSQKAFLDWFWTFQDQFLQGTRCTYDTSHSTPLAGSDSRRQPDLFLTPSHTTKRDGKHSWTDVQVIGELKQSENQKEFKKELVWFCGHAREVFKCQPTRRFLHGFFIRGSMVEPWVLDRSGPYSGEKFDIHKDPRRFVRLMAGYALMTDKELGINTYIKKDKDGIYIMFKGDDEPQETKLRLEDRPIAFQRAIVCRGTTCYRAKRPKAKRWEFVVKFAWRSDKRHAEGNLLKLAKQRNVWGVARLFGHQDLESVADLRQGMEFASPRTFRLATGSSVSESQSRTSGLLSGPGISQPLPSSSSSGLKRKRQIDTSSAQVKRSRSESSRRRLDITGLIKGEDDRPEEDDRHSVEQPNTTSLIGLAGQKDGSFDNRIFSCLVISPPGRPIHDFKSIKEFLEACRDIVKAHRSLYLDGNILHRDISENNLIITDTENEGEPKGMLIDLDLGKERDSGPTGARHRTGTMEFMAIEVLMGTVHTYRHDLESFFYVFLWVIIRHDQRPEKNLPKTSQLRDWYQGTYSRIADMKGRHMDKARFRDIIAEFPSEFGCLKELAQELRRALFPIRDESLFTGTYRDPEKLYMPMIDALDRAIAKYGDG